MRHGLLYTLLFIIAIVIVVIIFAWIGMDKIVEQFKEIGLQGASIYFAAAILGLLSTSAGWQFILHSHQIKATFTHTTIGQLIGNAIGFITPSMYVGGEPVKAHYIGTLYNTSKTKVFSTAVFAKFQELASLMIFIYAGTLVMIIEAQEVHLPRGIWTILLIVDILLGIFVILSLRSIVNNSPLISHIFAWVARRGIFVQKIEKIIPKIIKIEELICHAFRHNWKAGAVAFAFNFFSIIIVIAKPVIFFYFLYHENILSLTQIAAIFTLSQILLVFQITPGCIGVFEGGQIGIFAIVGIDPIAAASYLIIYRFVDLVMTGSGVYLAIHYNLVKFVSPKIETVPHPVHTENPEQLAPPCAENQQENSGKTPTSAENSRSTGTVPK